MKNKTSVKVILYMRNIEEALSIVNYINPPIMGHKALAGVCRDEVIEKIEIIDHKEYDIKVNSAWGE